MQSMLFFDLSNIPPFQILPGAKTRTPFGKNLMLSYLKLAPGAVIPLHQHPHARGEMESGSVVPAK